MDLIQLDDLKLFHFNKGYSNSSSEENIPMEDVDVVSLIQQLLYVGGSFEVFDGPAGFDIHVDIFVSEQDLFPKFTFYGIRREIRFCSLYMWDGTAFVLTNNETSGIDKCDPHAVIEFFTNNGSIKTKQYGTTIIYKLFSDRDKKCKVCQIWAMRC